MARVLTRSESRYSSLLLVHDDGQFKSKDPAAGNFTCDVVHEERKDDKVKLSEQQPLAIAASNIYLGELSPRDSALTNWVAV